MNQYNLFFIPILAKALDNDDQILAVEKALRDISRHTNQKANSKRDKPFYEFIKYGLQSSNVNVDELETRFVNMFANELLMNDEIEYSEILKLIQKHPSSAMKYKRVKSDQKESNLKIEIYRGHKIFSSINLDLNQKEMIFTGIEPEYYGIQLSNGRILWEGRLELTDVRIQNEQKGSEYYLAAKTDIDMDPSKAIEIIKDEMTMYIYPGLEFGKIVLVQK